MKTSDVRFWTVRKKESTRKDKAVSYEVRWVVGRRAKSTTRKTRALAENFLSQLRQAAREGELFDTESGLPGSLETAAPAKTWLSFVLSYVDVKWPHAAAKTRESMTDALATVTAALVEDMPGRPDEQSIREALRQHMLAPASRGVNRRSEVALAASWLERASLPLPELAKTRVARLGLNALMLRMDGSAAAATTIRRKRAVFYNALQYAVELEDLPANPLDRIKWKPPKVAEVVDRRVVVNPRQAQELLTAVTYASQLDRGRHLKAFFACLYFAALRPGEAKALRQQDCFLPEEGWGRLTLSDSIPETNSRWTDSGDTHDNRGLKHRAAEDTRPVPIPPKLVAILREHIAEFGVGDDGRLFRTRRGRPISQGTYGKAWANARLFALTPDRIASPIAARPYDLRHAAVSLWLNAGVPATQVAQRAGHGVDVLLRVYATCIDGDEEIANSRISDALEGH